MQKGVFPWVSDSFDEAAAEEAAHHFHFRIDAKKVPTGSKVVDVTPYRELVIWDDSFICPIRSGIQVGIGIFKMLEDFLGCYIIPFRSQWTLLLLRGYVVKGYTRALRGCLETGKKVRRSRSRAG